MRPDDPREAVTVDVPMADTGATVIDEQPPVSMGARNLLDAGDRYEARRMLGRGGMGVVYRVLDRSTGEERALKRLVGELAAHEAMDFWAADHYRALYRTVLDRRPDVWRVMRAHGLGSPGEDTRALGR